MAKPAKGSIGNRLAPPRFILFALLFVAGIGTMLALGQRASHAVMAGFDVAAMVFLLSLWPLLKAGEAASMREAAARNDANRVMLLAITGAVMVVILVVIAAELAEGADGWIKALILATLTLAWLFSNIVYALHYAHLFYAQGKDGDAGGIGFPDTAEPDYWDFIYFAFTLGMTFQTSDVEIRERSLRRVVIIHCFAAFLFNLGVIAFTINVLGSG